MLGQINGKTNTGLASGRAYIYARLLGYLVIYVYLMLHTSDNLITGKKICFTEPRDIGIKSVI